jgi:hypothetical protein
VVEVLRERDIAVAAHIRPDSSQRDDLAARFTGLGAAVSLCSWEPEALTAALAEFKPHLVFCLIGTTRSRARRDGVAGDIYESVDYSLSSMLLRASVACGSNPKFVYLSSLGVGERAPKNAYLRARYKVEQELQGSGLQWVSARPSFITGDRTEARPMESVGATLMNVFMSAAAVVGARNWADTYRSQTGRELASALVSLALDRSVIDCVVESAELIQRHEASASSSI